MNATDLVTDFYASHPAAIRTCIKTMETTEEHSLSCPSSHPSNATQVPSQNQNPHIDLGTKFSVESNRTVSNHTQPVFPSHTTLRNSPSPTNSRSSYQQPESQDRYREPSISPTNTPSSTPASARNTTAPTTASQWHSIQTYLAKDSPRLPSSPLEQRMASPLSEYTWKPTTSTSLSPSSDAMTSPSDYTGPTGNQEKKKLSSITTELMSQLTVKNRSLALQSDISATTIVDPPSISNPPQKNNQSHQDARPYIRQDQKSYDQNPSHQDTQPYLRST